MAEKPTPPETSPTAQADAPQESRRNKRAAPTIDLTATEVPRETAAGDAPPPQQPGAETSKTAKPGRPQPSIVRLGIAAGGGVVAVLLILFALWLRGMLPIGYAGSSDLQEKVAALEKQLSDLQARPQAPSAGADDALNQRLGKIEAALAKPAPGDANIADKLAAADNAMKSLGVALTALNQRADSATGNAAEARKAADAAAKAVTDLQASLKATAANTAAGVPRAAVDALEQRIGALENSAKTARDDIAKNTGNDRAARLALSAAVLRDAVQGGAPFASELVQAKSLGADDKVLAPLELFAAAGVPTAQALAQELRAMLPGLVKLWRAQAPEGGFIERLEANAGRLVRITPIDAPPGNNPSAVLARVEIDAARADIPAALADLGKLPDLKLTDEARAPLQMWIAKAQRRQAALDAARQFAAAAASSLGQP